MITLVPLANFAVSAMVMPTTVLRTCLVSARNTQMLLQNRPEDAGLYETTKMWRGCTMALMLYSDCLVRELHRRHVPCRWHVLLGPDWRGRIYRPEEIVMPRWLGDHQIHREHRAILCEIQERSR